MKATLLTLVVAMLLFGAQPLSADAKFALNLTVTDTTLHPECPNGPNTVEHFFGCAQLGDTYVATFSVDQSLLSQSGNDLPGTIQHFYLKIGTVVWDQDHPKVSGGKLVNDFDGFLGPCDFDPQLRCRWAASPGFDVFGGTITGLEGGVFGISDMPFVDFFGPTYHAQDTLGSDFYMTGVISRVDEPAALSLLLFPLSGFLLVRKKNLLSTVFHNRQRLSDRA